MYIIDSKRTPIGKFLGSLSNLSATELAQPLFAYFLKKYPFLKTHTNEVILGNVLSAGVGMNPARIAAIAGGMHYSVPAYTINHVCASSMNAVTQGWRAIRAGQADLVLAGGMESMSQAPYLLKGGRKGLKYGQQELIDSLHYDGLFCSITQEIMGINVERIAKKYAVTRAMQDRFALESHKRAVAAQKHQVFDREVVAIAGLTADETPRPDTTLAKLSALKPGFRKNGTVTAGNASTLNDGASLMLLASDAAVTAYHLKPMAKILDAVFAGVQPEYMGMGPKRAIELLLKRNALNIPDIDLFEINEAFAVQVIAVMRELKLKPSHVNIYGGAIALGHPLGMSGARIIGSLVNGLKHTKSKLGIASLCVGGGQGAAVLIENLL
jgi:acetyl-CoA C-acetyltransferase